LNAGDLLDGRYRLDGPIAAGGMGDVWRATDTVLARVVAVKVLHPRLHDDEGFGARFRAEARTMAALHHPGVVEVYDYGEVEQPGNGPLAYLVMAYVQGDPLSQRIAAAGRLEPAQTVAVIAQAAHALHAAHEAGVVHRDVKPSNLLIEPDGRVVLVDFGVARAADTANLTRVDEVIGTALYMAPEQVSKQAISPATDIYALGAVTYHCLTGHPPFSGDNALTVALHHLVDDPPPMPDDVPAPVRALVTTAMAKNPADRYPSAAAMARAAEAASEQLVNIGNDHPTTASLPESAFVPGFAAAADGPDGDDSALEYAQRPSSRRRLATALAAILLGLAVVAAVLVFASPWDSAPGQNNGPVTPGPASVTAKPSQVDERSPSAGTRHSGGQTGSARPGPTLIGSAPASPMPQPTAQATGAGSRLEPVPSTVAGTGSAG
jgi:serine/threonine-protein kinase